MCSLLRLKYYTHAGFGGLVRSASRAAQACNLRPVQLVGSCGKPSFATQEPDDMYPVELTTPMARDLTEYNFEALTTPDDVDRVLSKPGTLLLVVNSVCGCAAAMARPGAKFSLQNEHTPDKLATVFAGVDRAATARAREYLLPHPPSSPCIALFRDGKLVHILERHHIEGRSAEVIAANLRLAYDRFCVPAEK